jgi:hypothetical protein
MLKKTINYTDYNGIQRSEDHYFNISRAEALKMELGTTGGYVEMINRMIEAKDQPALLQVFDEFILSAYGVKSPDGKRFDKEDENGRPLALLFKRTEAYSVLLWELITNAEEAAKFINGVISSVGDAPAAVPAAAN